MAVLKELILTVSTLGRSGSERTVSTLGRGGGLERTDLTVSTLIGCRVLKELNLTVSTLGEVQKS